MEARSPDTAPALDLVAIIQRLKSGISACKVNTLWGLSWLTRAWIAGAHALDMATERLAPMEAEKNGGEDIRATELVLALWICTIRQCHTTESEAQRHFRPVLVMLRI
jgi:hypothetical protein